VLGHNPWLHGLGNNRKGLVPEELLQNKEKLRKKRSVGIPDWSRIVENEI